MPRKLRIAASVCFAALAIALCLLWVRSYWLWDDIFWVNSGAGGAALSSSHGQLRLGPCSSVLPVVGLIWQSYPPEGFTPAPEFYFSLRHRSLAFPYWFAVLTGCIVTGAPWLREQYSLRTLLIITTLVAIVLGLAVWLSS
jgi:hypothetical protein